MNGNLDFKLGQIESKIDSLHQKIDGMSKHGERITRIEEWKGIVQRISGYVLAPLISAIILAVVTLWAKKG